MTDTNDELEPGTRVKVPDFGEGVITLAAIETLPEKFKIKLDTGTTITALRSEFEVLPLPITTRATLYLHGGDNYEEGKKLGLRGKALDSFAKFALYEVKVEGDVDRATGDFTITHVDGRALAPKG